MVTASAQGGVWDGVILHTQRGAAFCREALRQDSVLCVDVSPQALHRTPPSRVSHLPCTALGVETAPGMNTNRQLGETAGCQPKVGRADRRPCGK